MRRRVQRLFALISRLGDGMIWYVLMLSLPLVGGTQGWRVSLELALGGAIALTLYKTLKRWTRRPRPCAHASGTIVALVRPLDEFSFPSGHTLHAVTFSTIVCVAYPTLLIVFVPLSLLIAASRVVLGLHYPSDVLVACVIGLMLGGAVSGTLT
jgi:undecaprenyl-diphosphatase